MKSGSFLMTGFVVSIAVHVAVVTLFWAMEKIPAKKIVYPSSVLVPVATTPKHEKTVEPKKTPEIKKTTTQTPVKKIEPMPPVPQKPEDAGKPRKSEEVQPVFGMKSENLSSVTSGGMAIRTGNTLMKEQEKKPTPPSKIKPFVPVPVFDLNTLPEFRKKVVPEYPEALKNDGRQGEAVLSADIDETGHVADVRVIRASHPLFARSAAEALKKSVFTPGTRNGKHVATVLDDLVYTFIIDK